MGQIQPDGVGGRPFADDDIDGIVLHGRIQDLLHRPVQPVDLIHKKNIILIEVGQQRRQIARLFNGRAGGNANIDAHFGSNNACQCRLAQSRRAVQQHMIQRLTATARRLDEHGKVSFCLLLSDVFLQGMRPQRLLLGVLRQEGGGYNRLFVNVASVIDAHVVPSPTLPCA